MTWYLTTYNAYLLTLQTIGKFNRKLSQRYLMYPGIAWVELWHYQGMHSDLILEVVFFQN